MIPRDTIFATSTGAPPAAIAIIRISGPDATLVATALAGVLPEARRASVRSLRDPSHGAVLDRAVVLLFDGPRTATGEDLVEFHVHGGRAVVAAILGAIASQPGTRLAEPGEFTRRALENGVIDLTEAEGLGDLLSAQTEGQRRAAMRVAEGGLRALIEGWTTELIGVAAQIEAQLDFSDEDDVAEACADTIASELLRIAGDMAKTLRVPAVERLHEGVRVVIAGPPNSGKSTLLNVLTGRDIAIVSPISGTTRDRIEAPVIRDGVVYLLTDTAGLTEDPGDAVERIGVERAKGAIIAADIIIWLDSEDEAAPGIKVHPRADAQGRFVIPQHCDLSISAKTGAGIDALWRLIAERASALLPTSDAVAVNVRQRTLLERCFASLQGAQDSDMLIMAEEVRQALRALDEISGRSAIEDVLDAVFQRFCIGK